MPWTTLPPEIDAVRARWRDAPPKLGPYSRCRASVDLMRHALADVRSLLAALDTTHGDPVGDLCDELAALGAEGIVLTVELAGRGFRSRYRVRWTLHGRRMDAEGWCPAVALRAAVRAAGRVSAAAA